VRRNVLACGIALSLSVCVFAQEEEGEQPFLEAERQPLLEEMEEYGEPASSLLQNESTEPIPVAETSVMAPDFTGIHERLDALEAALQALRQEVLLAQSQVMKQQSDLSDPMESQSGGFPETPSIDELETVTDIDAEEDSAAEAVGLSAPEAEKVSTIYDPAKQLFKQGKTAFRDLDFYLAARHFSEFLEKYPTHDRAMDARYWLGEVAYEQGDFQAAVKSLEQVASAPDSPHQRVAQFKMGYALFELKDFEKARTTLLEVQQASPGSNLARLAQLRLERLERLIGDE